MLDYRSLGCQANGMTALDPDPPPELGENKCRPEVPEAGLLLQ